MSIQKIISITQSGTRAVGAKRNYEYIYRVKADPGDGVNEVLLDPQVPSLSASLNDDRRATIKTKKATLIDGTNYIWDMTLSLDTEPIPQAASDADQEENPLERPPEVSWDYMTLPFIITKTVDDTPKPIQNTAGEPYIPGIEVEEGIAVLHVVRNEANFSASTMLQYGNTVNSSTFYGASAGQAKLLPPRAQRVVENDLTYWRVSYEVHFRLLGWKFISLNQGRSYLKTANNFLTRTAALDKDGQHVTDPVKLKEDGTLWTSGAEFYNQFTIYKSKNFSPLRLEAV